MLSRLESIKTKTVYTSSQKFGHTCIFNTFYAVDTNWRNQIYEQEMWIHVPKEKKSELP